jgi:hypothetical protein
LRIFFASFAVKGFFLDHLHPLGYLFSQPVEGKGQRSPPPHATFAAGAIKELAFGHTEQ